MNQFYISVIFIGILLIIVSFVWILYDQKKSLDYRKNIDEKKEDLVAIINEAEVMIDELNKISDYVISQIEAKNEEAQTTIERTKTTIEQADRKIEELRTMGNKSGSHLRQETRKIENVREVIGTQGLHLMNFAQENKSEKRAGNQKEKIVHITSRQMEVLSLFENGFGEEEIAKRLNMGKGEIQLILGINK